MSFSWSWVCVEERRGEKGEECGGKEHVTQLDLCGGEERKRGQEEHVTQLDQCRRRENVYMCEVERERGSRQGPVVCK